jgi:hypothetical protein
MVDEIAALNSKLQKNKGLSWKLLFSCNWKSRYDAIIILLDKWRRQKLRKRTQSLVAKCQCVLNIHREPFLLPLIVVILHLFPAFLTLVIKLCKSQMDFQNQLQGSIPVPVDK